MKIILKYKHWNQVIQLNNREIKLWELIPQPLDVSSIEYMPFVTNKVYHASFKDITCIVLENEIDKFIDEESDPLNLKL